MTATIQGYHAHVYFNAASLGRAKALCERAAATFVVKMGRVHEKPVGPHPDWSCQLRTHRPTSIREQSSGRASVPAI